MTLKMKRLLVLLLLFKIDSAFSQLQIEEKSKIYISHSADKLIDFVEANHFDYALMGWYTSSQVRISDKIYCLFQQRNNWYLAKIIRVDGNSMEPVKYDIKQLKLNNLEADSMQLMLDAPSAFKYTMADFDKLPPSCQYQKNGKTTGLIGVADASTYHLLQVSNHEKKSIYYYAPDHYYDHCYPYVKEFGILKGLIQTVNQLSKQTDNLQD